MRELQLQVQFVRKSSAFLIFRCQKNVRDFLCLGNGNPVSGGECVMHVSVARAWFVQRLLVTSGSLSQSPVVIFDKYEFLTSFLSPYSQDFAGYVT